MTCILSIIQVYLVFLSLLESVESVRRAIPSFGNSTRVIVQFSRPASGDIQAQQREGVSGEILDAEAARQRNDFISSIKTSGLRGNIVHTYSNLFNGVSLKLENANDLKTLKSMPGVLEVFPVRTYTLNPLRSAKSQSLLNEPVTSDIFKNTQHVLTGVDIIHREHPELVGKDVKVGIVDTGIDYLHPAFAVPGQKCTTFKGPGCRVQFGKDFVGDDFDGKDNVVLQSDEDPMDNCNGHGTHVAGIIGGNDEKVKGVAQGVTFGSYRIFGCSGSTSDDIFIAGLEAAFKDGMQVINLSLGGGAVDNSYPTAQAVDKLSAQGVIIISSAGNEGEDGYSTVSSPGVAKLGIATASYDNKQSYGTFFKATGAPGLDIVAFRYSSSSGVSARFKETTPLKVIISPQTTAQAGDGCSAYKADTFKDGVALILRSGLCSFSEMVANAVSTGGATGVIIYNSAPGDLAGILNPTIANFPTAFIAGADGAVLAKAASGTGSVTVTFDNKEKISPFKNAGRPSDFSSMGLDLSLLMKPDLGAPGGHIISTFPRDLGSYAEESGTSMAAPYLAGVAALEVQRSAGKTKFLELQRRLHITAKVTMGTAGGKALTVAKTGAGLVDVPKFLFSTVDIEPSKLELGDGMALRKQSIKVTNNGAQPVTYKITHLPSESFKVEGGVPQHLIVMDSTSSADMALSAETITVPPGQSVPFDVTIGYKATSPHVVHSGFIKFDNSADPKASLAVPYTLMTGDYSKLPLIGTKASPALYPANVVDNISVKALTSNPIFDLKTKATSPALVFESVFPVRRMDLVLVSADNNTPIGLLYSLPYCEPFTATAFDMESQVSDLKNPSQKIDVPNGNYKIVAKAVLPRPLTPVPDVSAALVTIVESIPFKVENGAK